MWRPWGTDTPDFRCEKVDEGQLARLARCGLSDVLADATVQNRTLWVGRGGRVVERSAYVQATSPYEAMVETMRRAVGGSARVVREKVVRVDSTDDMQALHTSDGATWSARLVVVATGPSPRLVKALGFRRTVLSKHHSISIGFDLVPRGGGGFPFESITWFPERFDGCTAYITVFRMGAVWRANLFVYRRPADPWFDFVKRSPVQAMAQLMPGFVRVTGPFSVEGKVRVRPVDLYQAEDIERPGTVLIGDAYATSDPAAGTGFDKAWNDVHRLVDGHLPGWLASPGMGVDKLKAFYTDPEKVACDAWCRQRAFDSRDLATSSAPYWWARRRAAWAVQVARGGARSLLAPPAG